MSAPIYDDGNFRVRKTLIETPTRLYPLAGTNVSLRRDPLWAGFFLATFSGIALFVYGDLLRPEEAAWLVAMSAVSLVIGRMILILRLEAPGHRRAFLFGRRSRILGLYRSIAEARSCAGEFPIIISGNSDT
jgi:hypothetical protein